MRAARLIGQALIALALLIAPMAGPLAAEGRTVTPAETRQLAARALLSGYPAHALELAQALLALDPGDVAAATTASRAARTLGDEAAAQAYARMAWQAAQSDKERYHASVAMAQALASDEKRTRAQFWLRRAAHHAPDARARAAARRDFKYVRGRNPWRSHLSFGLSPSSNINNGAATDRIEIDGLSFQLSGDARALSGTELDLGVSTEYRIRSGPRTILTFGASAEARRYWLSGEAKKQAPDADAGDYAYGSGELTFGLIRAPRPRPQGAEGPAFGLFEASLGIGKSWYGGEELLTYTRLRASQRFRLAPRTSGKVSLNGEWQNRLDLPRNSMTASELQLSLSHRFDAGMLTLAASTREVVSESDLVAHSGRRLSASYQLAKPVLKALTTLSAEVEHRDYESSLFGADRSDTRTELGLSLFFVEADAYGFAPEVGITWEQNNSTVDLYSTETFGVTLGLRSTF